MKNSIISTARKAAAIAAIAAFAAALPAQAFADDDDHEHENRCSVEAGYTGPVAKISIQDALKAKEDTNVIVEGKIVKQTGRKTFVIADQSGQADAKISRRDFCGQKIGPDDTVRIYGEIDVKNGKTVIDADALVKL